MEVIVIDHPHSLSRLPPLQHQWQRDALIAVDLEAIEGKILVKYCERTRQRGRANLHGNRPSDVERRLRRERKTAREEARCAQRLAAPLVEWKRPVPACICCGRRTGGCFFPPCGGDEGFFICEGKLGEQVN